MVLHHVTIFYYDKITQLYMIERKFNLETTMTTQILITKLKESSVISDRV